MQSLVAQLQAEKKAAAPKAPLSSTQGDKAWETLGEVEKSQRAHFAGTVQDKQQREAQALKNRKSKNSRLGRSAAGGGKKANASNGAEASAAKVDYSSIPACLVALDCHSLHVSL